MLGSQVSTPLGLVLSRAPLLAPLGSFWLPGVCLLEGEADGLHDILIEASEASNFAALSAATSLQQPI